MKLTDKQEKFCNEYLIDLNATQAAIRSGYSEKTAQIIGFENLSKPIIANRICELREEIKEATEITPEYIINNLKKAIAISLGYDPHHVIVKDGDGQGGSVTTSQELNKTDLPSFLKTNEMLMKHIGMFDEHNKQKNKDTKVTLFQLPENGRG